MMTHILLLITLLFLHTGINAFADDINSTVKSAQQEISTFIEVSDVPKSAATVLMEIKDISDALEVPKAISEMHTSLPPYIDAIDSLLQDPTSRDYEDIPLYDLQKKVHEWTIHLDKLVKWDKLLRVQIGEFDTTLKRLEEYSSIWSSTHINANKELAPRPILDHITTVLIKIEESRDQAKTSYDLLLTDSNIINTKILSIKERIQKTDEAIAHVSSQFFSQNELPLTTLLQEGSFAPLRYLSSVYHSIIEDMNSFFIYYQDKPNRLWKSALFSAFIILFVGSFNYLYRKKRLFVHAGSYQKKEYSYITLPLSTSILLILFINVLIFKEVPENVKHFQMLFWMIPVFRIFQRLITERIRRYLYLYFTLYLLFMLKLNATGHGVDDRLFSLLLTLSLTFFMLFMIRDRVFDSLVRPILLKSVYRLLALSVLLLVISLGADLYGATILADRITSGVFISMFTSMIFYILTIILTGYTIILLRRRLASSAFMLERFNNNIQKVMTLSIRVIMTVWWFLLLTQSIGVDDSLIAFKDQLLAYSWEIGTTTISIRSVFDFALIIIGTWFIVKLTNIIMHLFLFSRFRFPRGIPTAITTVLNYTIIISGTVIALSSLGISAEQFTLVIGALGVGIGFGLRNIIANFISGLIMVFERPIQIGDSIEINQTTGTVQSIGTRSSTIKTFDGSEVIIPNADFIAKEITNWTLSDERRRKTLVFRVDHGSDIRQVLAIMHDVAAAHHNVLQEPEPMATFLVFGEYYLEFKLYYWLSDNIIMAPSDVAINVYEALQKSGIKMPLPKQEFLKGD